MEIRRSTLIDVSMAQIYYLPLFVEFNPKEGEIETYMPLLE
jgi:hypothetical protein